ncbi:hypothetical protein GCM10025873_00910 [Demequina sediminis]|nr:hypothetical protein GCM10025873_00910 [Demequina sediminis]
MYAWALVPRKSEIDIRDDAGSGKGRMRPGNPDLGEDAAACPDLWRTAAPCEVLSARIGSERSLSTSRRAMGE